jgi:membrane protease YdiL (CAAX protease family)
MFAFLAMFFTAWSIWCIVLVQDPQTYGSGAIRLLARLLLWIVPTLLFVRWSQPRPVLDYLHLRSGVKRGVLWGLAAAIVHPLAEAVYRLASGSASFALPDWSEWANPILGAPLAEELLFRGVVLQRFAQRQRLSLAVVASAILFSLIHLPYWWLAGQFGGSDLVLNEAKMVVYGIAFAAVFLASGSLWAPLIYHWVNNFLSVAVTNL